MFATLLDAPVDRSVAVGDLVLVEVPDNCTIHAIDAARLSRLRQAATELRALVESRTLGSPIDAAVAKVAAEADWLLEDG